MTTKMITTNNNNKATTPPSLDRFRVAKKGCFVLDSISTTDDALRRKKVSSPLATPDESTLEDPFAGMNSAVNYQQEIERLKALVPKVDPNGKSKQRISSRSKGTATTTSKRSSPRTSTASMGEAMDHLPSTVSPMATPRSMSPNEEDVITEEEKIRFLEFMKNWTGSWKAWDGSHPYDTTALESIRDDRSLWARQMPWARWQEPA
ncbi:hypothetical protein BX666DRAFT_1542330 [Dichotomocladium elegans]|nr:hypothetical protein BX666DRAFT_1542330 [Dichotomocladium elegans]